MSIDASETLGRCIDFPVKQDGYYTLPLFIYNDAGALADLTPYTFASELRDINGTLIATLACSVIDMLNGAIQVVLNATGIAPGNYYWDLKATTAGKVKWLAYGKVTVFKKITQ